MHFFQSKFHFVGTVERTTTVLMLKHSKMKLFSKEIVLLCVIFEILLLSSSIEAATTAGPSPAQKCGIKDADRGTSIGACCGPSLGPLDPKLTAEAESYKMSYGSTAYYDYPHIYENKKLGNNNNYLFKTFYSGL